MRVATMGWAFVFGLAAAVGAAGVARAAPPGWPTGKQAAPEEPPPEPGDVISGNASFTLGKDTAKLPVASGTIQKLEGIYMVQLSFRDAKTTSENVAQTDGKILKIGFGTSGPGPAQIITMFVARSGKVLSLYRSSPPVNVPAAKSKAKGNCTISVTKIEEKSVEGTAICPSGMVNMDEVDSPPVTAVTFKATAL